MVLYNANKYNIYIYIHSVNNHIFIMWSGFPPAYWDLYFRTNTPPTWASACPMGSKGNLRDTSCALLSKSWWKGGEKMVEGFAMVCFHVFILQDGGITCGRMGSCFDTIMCTTVGLLTYLTCDFLGKRSIEQRHVFFVFVGSPNQKNMWLFSAMCSPGMMVIMVITLWNNHLNTIDPSS